MMSRLLGSKVSFDGRIAIVTILSTLLLMVDAYQELSPHRVLDRIILFLAIPLTAILVVFRERPREFGLAVGDWRAGIPLTCAAIVAAAPVVWLAAQTPSIKDYYGSGAEGLPWNTFLDLVGWEFFFRGFILFSYTRRFGADGLWLHMVPFALAHIGKPPLETYSTVLGGFALGWLAYRTRSFAYPFLVHWFIGTAVVMVATAQMR
jgi:membrane protease YdiL (CAAX protease family)